MTPPVKRDDVAWSALPRMSRIPRGGEGVLWEWDNSCSERALVCQNYFSVRLISTVRSVSGRLPTFNARGRARTAVALEQR